MKSKVKQTTATLIVLLVFVGQVLASELPASAMKTIETELNFENWMTDESVWETRNFLALEFAPETETALELESWMTGEKTWEFNTLFLTEMEADLEVEAWMTENFALNVHETINEEELAVENWMVDSNFWD